MFGVSKATMLLVGAAAAGVLIWVATQLVGDALDTAGDFWAAAGLLAVAGLVLSTLHMLGRVGAGVRPVLSPTAFLLGFLPVLVVGGFVVWYAQPEGGWLVGDTRAFADDIGVDGLVADLARFWPVLAFGIGVVLGLTFDAVPRRVERVVERRDEVEPVPAGATRSTDPDRERRDDAAEAPTVARRGDYDRDRTDDAETPPHPLTRQ